MKRVLIKSAVDREARRRVGLNEINIFFTECYYGLLCIRALHLLDAASNCLALFVGEVWAL